MKLHYPGLPLPHPDGPKLDFYERRREMLHQANAYFIPYGALTLVYKNHPAAQDFGARWGLTDELQGAWGWGSYMGLPDEEEAGLPVDFTVKSVQDFMVAQQVKAIEQHEHAGIYYDGHEVKHNGVEKRYGGKPVDLTGKLYVPLYGFRETMQRIWNATKGRDPKFLITCHSGVLSPFAAIYVDAGLLGEAYNTLFRHDPTAVRLRGGFAYDVREVFVEKEGVAVPQWRNPEWYRPAYFEIPEDNFATYVNQNRGYTFYLLPQVAKRSESFLAEHPGQSAAWTRELLARSLVHNTPLWVMRLDSPTAVRIYRVLYEFGLQRDDTRHLSVYESPNRIDIDAGSRGRLMSAAWYRPDHMLIVVTNPSGDPVRVHMTPPLRWAEQNGEPISVTNAETGSILPFDRRGRVSVSVPGKDFRLVRLDF